MESCQANVVACLVEGEPFVKRIPIGFFVMLCTVDALHVCVVWSDCFDTKVLVHMQESRQYRNDLIIGFSFIVFFFT